MDKNEYNIKIVKINIVYGQKTKIMLNIKNKNIVDIQKIKIVKINIVYGQKTKIILNIKK